MRKLKETTLPLLIKLQEGENILALELSSEFVTISHSVTGGRMRHLKCQIRHCYEDRANFINDLYKQCCKNDDYVKVNNLSTTKQAIFLTRESGYSHRLAIGWLPNFKPRLKAELETLFEPEDSNPIPELITTDVFIYDGEFTGLLVAPVPDRVTAIYRLKEDKLVEIWSKQGEN